MRYLIFLGLLIAAPAFASSDLIVKFCNAQPDPRACIRGFIDEQVVEHQAAQEQSNRRDAEIRQQYLANQLEQARIQANGMALFGSGPALIQGMNQGFQMMRQPYISTPAQQYGR